jgi:hypothetical protein
VRPGSVRCNKGMVGRRSIIGSCILYLVDGGISHPVMSIFLLPTLYVWTAARYDMLPAPEREFQEEILERFVASSTPRALDAAIRSTVVSSSACFINPRHCFLSHNQLVFSR